MPALTTVLPTPASRPDQQTMCLTPPGTGRPRAVPVDLAIDPPTAHRLQLAREALPDAGGRFLSFTLERELGRGAFGRVFLARQSELANREVALKITAEDFGEAATLARLQHTNIVPVHSVHGAGLLRAVCMPYFGGTTLAEVLKQVSGPTALPRSGTFFASTLRDRLTAADRPVCVEPAASPDSVKVTVKSGTPIAAVARLSYVEAVLWIGVRLADGLAHAHDRGILHRDLKPANVLLADDGQPMLLDFNLAADTRSTTAALVGGTLPYMSPEQIAEYQGGGPRADARSDVYSLGLVLYELLAGQLPFPSLSDPSAAMLFTALSGRTVSASQLRTLNPAVSPATAAIIARCLEAEPSRRYQSAHELREDLERQLSNRPLRHAAEPSVVERATKWARRHPRLASPGVAAAIAAAVLLSGAAFSVHRSERARLADIDLAQESAAALYRTTAGALTAAQDSLAALSDDPTRRTAVLADARAALDRYKVMDDPDWKDRPAVRMLGPDDRDRLYRDVGNVLYLLSRAERLQSSVGSPDPLNLARRLHALAEAHLGEDAGAALALQRAELSAAAGRHEEATTLRNEAKAAAAGSPRAAFLLASEYAAQGRYRDALGLVERVTRERPDDVPAWFVRGLCHDALGQDELSVAAYGACIALRPNFGKPFYNRGLAQFRQHNYAGAKADLDQAVRLDPDFADARVQRAVTLIALRKYEDAIADLTGVLERGDAPTRAFFLRARARDRAGDKAGAARDRAEGLRRTPTDAASYVERGLARLAQGPADALEDFRAAERLEPRFLPALQNQAHVLSDALGRTADAVACLDRALAVQPQHVPSLAGRAVLLARLGRLDEALRDARACLAADRSPSTLYQVAGAFALAAKDRPELAREAFRLIATAISQGFGADQLASDPDLGPIRSQADFRDLESAAAVLKRLQQK